MYQSVMSEFLAEFPMHLLVYLCGAFGYVATRWASSHLSPSLFAVRQRESLQEAAVEASAAADSAELAAASTLEGDACSERSCLFDQAPLPLAELSVLSGDVLCDSQAQQQLMLPVRSSDKITAPARSACVSELSSEPGSDSPSACEACALTAQLSEASTADEGQLSSWDAVETDSSWEGDEMIQFLEAQQAAPGKPLAPHTPAVPSACEHTHYWATSMWNPSTSDRQHQWARQSSWNHRQPESWIEDDGWMLPFDEMLQRRTQIAELTHMSPYGH